MRRLLAAVACVLSLLAAPAFAEDAYTFKVKGVVRGLPGDGRAANEILVKHEEITDYRDSSGEVVGMMAMTMPFYLSPQTSLAGIGVGDTVEMVVEQRLEPKYSEQVVKVSKLSK
jgi:Cu/Ag efflux protein CusF